MSEALGLPVDVHLLNDAQVSFRYHALRGSVLFVQEQEFLDEFRARTWDEYCDFAPFAKRYLQELIGERGLPADDVGLREGEGMDRETREFLENKFGIVEQRLTAIDGQLDTMDGRFDGSNSARFARIRYEITWKRGGG